MSLLVAGRDTVSFNLYLYQEAFHPSCRLIRLQAL